MNKKNFLEILEWTGSLMILTGYFLLIQAVLLSSDIEYFLINLVASAFLGTSLIFKKAYGASVLQLAFMVISLWGIIKYFLG